mmetsp:Transcript_14365/g.27381  ORF Transcript_14365/g.27381 Transcript_14365/m.27381 type:complete len:105 (+) Transcript_14365:1956-2270(+)
MTMTTTLTFVLLLLSIQQLFRRRQDLPGGPSKGPRGCREDEDNNNNNNKGDVVEVEQERQDSFDYWHGRHPRVYTTTTTLPCRRAPSGAYDGCGCCCCCASSVR